jgi:hypothetical protein
LDRPASLIRDKFGHHEIPFRDDCSTDGSHAIARLKASTFAFNVRAFGQFPRMELFWYSAIVGKFVPLQTGDKHAKSHCCGVLCRFSRKHFNRFGSNRRSL